MSNNGSTLYSSIRGGFGLTKSGIKSPRMRDSEIRGSSIRSSIRARNPKTKESMMAKMQQSFSKPTSPVCRRTIYLDQNNNIVDPTRSRDRSNRNSSKKSRNIPAVVFESGNKGIWDSISNLNDDNYNNRFKPIGSPTFMNKRIKSPNVIPNTNQTLDMMKERARLKTSQHRFKSTSPQNRDKKDNIQTNSLYHQFYNLKNAKAKAHKKRGMRTKV